MKKRRQCKTSRVWCYASYLVGVLVLLPVLTILASWLMPLSEHWDHIITTMLSRLVTNSLLLTGIVVMGTATIGVSLAWITGQIDFPGRKLFRKVLVLPLAIPSYVTGFIYLGIFDYAGPVPQLMRGLGWGQGFFEIRSMGGAAFVLILGLYPYVYLLSRQAFESQGSSYIEAARSLGVPYVKVFFSLAIPLARPWIFGALCLVAMDCLADFGTVSIFGVSTFTTAIYKAWFGFFSPLTAAQLSSGLLLFIGAIIFFNVKLGQRKSYVGQWRSTSAKTPRSPFVAWGCSLFCATVFSLAFLIPLGQLIVWAWSHWQQSWLHMTTITMNSFVLGASTAVLVCMCCIGLVFAQRFFPIKRIFFANRVAVLGYALPGAVLAIGLFLPLVKLDHFIADFWEGLWGWDPGLLLTGTIFVVLMGLTIRFMAVGHASISSAQERVSRRIDEAAINFGVYGWQQIRDIHLPIIWKSVMGAWVLVFIDTIKEMPLTLMTRPFGWDTLSVKIFELISEGEWERAALPALLLVCLSLIPVVILKKEG